MSDKGMYPVVREWRSTIAGHQSLPCSLLADAEEKDLMDASIVDEYCKGWYTIYIHMFR